MWQAASPYYFETAAPGAELAFREAMAACLRRIRAWRVPPNWALPQWHEEIEGHALAAACDAQAAYDPARGVPFGAFVYQHVMARVLTRYRQEWSYARRCVCQVESKGDVCPDCAAPGVPDHCDLDEAVASLSVAQRWLLEQLFWRERTESAVGSVLGLSQRAVSKRKQVVLATLRHWLDDQKNELPVLKRTGRGN